MCYRNSFLIFILSLSFADLKVRSVEENVKDPLLHTHYLDSLQLLAKYEYKRQKHVVVTDDGYILNLFRIPKDGPPVLLVHGIGDSSDSWLVLGPNYSLAYQLAEAGFDVWLHNSRGNKYSKGHIGNITPQQYWDFSFEEMGTNDLPAVIDYILMSTSHENLTFVGFSQGTTTFFVMCSMKPEYNTKIKQAVLLAPVAWLKNTRYPYIRALSRNLHIISPIAQVIGLYEVFPNNPIKNFYHAYVCREGVPAKVFCDIEFLLSHGVDVRNILPNKLSVIASHIPAGTSAKTFVHFIQGYRSKRFQRFDYGNRVNHMMYSDSRPPEYNLSLVRVPVNLIVSESDWFGDTDDVATLRSKLPNVDRFISLNTTLNFTHIEFVYGARVKHLINDPVLNILMEDNNTKLYFHVFYLPMK